MTAIIYILAMWLERLRDTGVRAELTHGGGTLIADGVQLIVRRRMSLRPGAVPPAEPGTVLWLPHASNRVAQVLSRAGWSWVTDDGDGMVRLGGKVIHLRPPEDGSPPEQAGVPARRTTAELAVLGRLLEYPGPHRQASVAEAVGITQPRVSQVLRAALDEGLVARTGKGWQVDEAARVFDVCAAPARELVTVEGWYHLRDAAEQFDLCLAAEPAAATRVSGDWAADRLAPWRLPRLAVVHADRTLPLEAVGFVPSDLADATLLTVTRMIRPTWQISPAIRKSMTTDSSPWILAPVHQVARDLLATGGPDATEACQQLKDSFLRARAKVCGADA